MRWIALVALLGLSGCGVAAANQTRADYQRSLSAYRECVQANGPDGCRREKAILDADAAAYTNVRTDTVIIRDK